MEVCRQTAPAPVPYEPGHTVSCHLFPATWRTAEPTGPPDEGFHRSLAPGLLQCVESKPSGDLSHWPRDFPQDRRPI